jgi:SNF2 family DNA or RNA helicase
MKVYCNLIRKQASLYAAVVEEAAGTLAGADGIQRKGVILGILSKLKQVCNHPARQNRRIPGKTPRRKKPIS